MRVTTKIIFDSNWNVLAHDWVEYDGPVALCCSSGDQTAKTSEQQTAAFQSQLMALFNKQYANQQSLMNFVKPYLQSQVTDPTGYSKTDLAAMRTGASDTISQETQNAERAAAAVQATHGGDALPSGVSSQINSQIATTGAMTDATTQNQITQADENLKLQNYWRAIGGLSGQAELENPQSYASSAISAGNSVANLSQAVLASQQAGWQDIGGIMSGIGGLATGAASMGTMIKA